MPFNHMHIGTDGKVKACCVANHDKPLLENFGDKTLEEIWSGKEYTEFRQAMLNGERHHHCENCYKMDEQGGGSDRQSMNKWFKAPNEHWDLDVVNGNTEDNPLWMDIRPGRFCNLGCRMCFVGVSSFIADEHKNNPALSDVTGESWVDIEEWLDNPVMFGSVKRMIPKLRTIKIAGGESLFMPGVIKMLQWCVDSGNTHLHLDITTNGTRTQGKVIKLLNKFSRVDIQLSIDGIGAVNDYVRYPSKWEEIDETYHTYLNMDSVESVNILSTVQIYNAFDLPNILKYWIDNGKKHNMIFNFVNWPRDLNINIMPLNDRLKLADQLSDCVSELTPEQRQQFRYDAVLYRLCDKATPSDLNQLRDSFVKRTLAYDKLRNQTYTVLHPTIEEYMKTWPMIKTTTE